MPNTGKSSPSRSNTKTRSASKKKINATKKRRKKNGNSNGLWKRILVGLAALAGIAILGGALLFFYYAAQAPEVNRADLVDAAPTQVLDSEGNLVKELGANGHNRDLVDMSEIPPVLVDAVLAIEDRRFYDHIGVDPIRIVGALFSNLQAGGIAAGGSTITQQLIKLSYFSTSEEDQTLERKAQEAWMAIQLERNISKDEILALYINKVYMGNNVYGMGAAAEYYFGKELLDITVDEAALLAGIPQAPSYYDPYENPEVATERRDTVLGAMVDFEKISPEEQQQAASVSLADKLVDHSGEVDNSLVLDAYIQIVMEEVEAKTGLDPTAGGMTIETNLDMDAQQRLYDIVNTDQYVVFPNDEIQTAVTLVDVDTGAVNAVIGNRKKENQLGINFATSEERSVASTIKPLIDFGPAIEYMNYSPGTLVVDEPYDYSNGDTLRNYDNEYKGEMTVREALVDSRNIPAYKVFQDVGADNASSFLNKVGIDIDPDELLPSNSINFNMSSVQLSAAYAAIANGGTYYEPYTVRSVTTQEGEEYTFEPAGTQAMKDSTAYLLTDMMKDVITYSAPEAQIPGLAHAGKTGTTDFNDEQIAAVGAEGVDNVGKDSWFAGFTTNYSLSVWLGYEDQFGEGNYMDYQTRNITRYIYRELMGYVSQDIENTDWVKPNSVVEAEIEKYSDPIMKPGPNTPSNLRISELFVKGSEPTQVSRKFGERLEAPKNLKASHNSSREELTVTWDEYKSDGRTPQYTLTVNGQSQTTNSNRVVIKNPPTGSVSITLTVKVGNTTSPAASITLSIGDSGNKNDKESGEEQEKESSSESESSSSTPPSGESGTSSSQDESEESPADDGEQANAEESSSAPEQESAEENENADAAESSSKPANESSNAA